MTTPLDPNDPREHRAMALRRLAQANDFLNSALGYLRNSDRGSGVIDDLVAAKDKVEELQRTLEWRQGREATP